MVIKYNVEINNADIKRNFERITNQIFKLLPSREECEDWQTPLQNLIIEVSGMANLLPDHQQLFSLLSKMEGLLLLSNKDDFMQFRKTIFECLSLIESLKKCLD